MARPAAAVLVPVVPAPVVLDPAQVVLLVVVDVGIPVAVAAEAMAPAPVAGFADLLVVAREIVVMLLGHLLVVLLFLRSATPQ